jgi:hypothetical protein
MNFANSEQASASNLKVTGGTKVNSLILGKDSLF